MLQEAYAMMTSESGRRVQEGVVHLINAMKYIPQNASNLESNASTFLNAYESHNLHPTELFHTRTFLVHNKKSFESKKHHDKPCSKPSQLVQKKP